MATIAGLSGTMVGAEAVAESVRYGRTLFEYAPFGLFLVEADRQKVYANRRLFEIMGLQAGEASEVELGQLFSAEALVRLQGEVQALLLESAPSQHRLELPMYCADGGALWVSLGLWALPAQNAETVFVAVRVAELRASARDLAQEERLDHRLRLMVEELHSMVWMTDAHGDIDYLNKASREYCNLVDAEARDSLGRIFTRPLQDDAYAEKFQRAVNERQSFAEEAHVLLPGGEPRIIGTKAQPSFSPSGEYIGHIGLSADITDRLRSEQAREFELTLVHSIQQETLEGILVVTGEGDIASLNQRFLDIHGIPSTICPEGILSKMIGRKGLELLDIILRQVADPDGFLQRVQELYDNPREQDYCEIVMKDGRTLERHSTSLWSQDERCLGRVWFVKDITGHKQAEQNLRRAKKAADEVSRQLLAKRLVLGRERRMLRALIDNIPDFMYVKDLAGRFVLANESLTRAAGFKNPEEIAGKTSLELQSANVASSFHETDSALLRSGQPVVNQEGSYRTRNGDEAYMLTTKVPIRDDSGKITGIACIGRDITAHKQYADALAQAEKKYRGIFDNAIFGIFQSTAQGRFLSVNPSMAAMLGYDSPEEVIGSIDDIAMQVYVNPADRLRFLERMNASGSAQNFEYEARRKDGSKFWISMSVRVVEQDGRILWYEGVCENITERRLLRDQLFQAQKLESVGQLAAGIAHEINTPTQYIGDNVRFLQDAFNDLKALITGYDQLLQAAQQRNSDPEIVGRIVAEANRVDAPFLLEEAPRAIEQALEGIGRVSSLVSAMKEFSHPGSREKVLVDVNHAIASTVTVTRNEWKYVADLDTKFDATLPMMLCLPAEFNQVILNLIVNSAHAIAELIRKGGPSKGRITIQTKNESQWAEIRVQDTGAGIPEEIRSRVFDPFFTTKEIGKGTGQGLAIARSVIVDKLGGSIHFETMEGEGTTFIIRLPHRGALQQGKAAHA